VHCCRALEDCSVAMRQCWWGLTEQEVSQHVLPVSSSSRKLALVLGQQLPALYTEVAASASGAAVKVVWLSVS
jgi:hypothetical protein